MYTAARRHECRPGHRLCGVLLPCRIQITDIKPINSVSGFGFKLAAPRTPRLDCMVSGHTNYLVRGMCFCLLPRVGAIRVSETQAFSSRLIGEAIVQAGAESHSSSACPPASSPRAARLAQVSMRATYSPSTNRHPVLRSISGAHTWCSGPSRAGDKRSRCPAGKAAKDTWHA